MSTEKTKLSKKNKDVILGIATLVFAAIYFFLTLSLPRTEGVVDSRFVPFLLCACLTIIGFFQIWFGIQKPASAEKKVNKLTRTPF